MKKIISTVSVFGFMLTIFISASLVSPHKVFADVTSVVDSTTPALTNSIFSCAITGHVTSSAPLASNTVIGYDLWADGSAANAKPILFGTNTAPDANNTVQFTMNFTNLLPGTKYDYSVYYNNLVTNFDGIHQPSPYSCTTLPPVVPGAPQNVTATGGDSLASISWQPPAFNGGSPITSYTININTPGVVFPPTTVTGTSDVMKGLTNGVTYTFLVSATNVVGTSGYATSNAVTPMSAPGSGGMNGTTPPSPSTPTDISSHFKIKNPLQSADMNAFIANVLNALILIVTPILVLMVIVSGFLFVKARGNAEELTLAKRALMYTLIGAALILGAKVISTLLSTTFNHF